MFSSLTSKGEPSTCHFGRCHHCQPKRSPDYQRTYCCCYCTRRTQCSHLQPQKVNLPKCFLDYQRTYRCCYRTRRTQCSHLQPQKVNLPKCSPDYQRTYRCCYRTRRMQCSHLQPQKVNLPRIINKPTVAAIAYGERNVLIFNLKK